MRCMLHKSEYNLIISELIDIMQEPKLDSLTISPIHEIIGEENG